MKKLLLLVMVLGLLVSGCVTVSSQYASGQAMSKEQVDRILDAFRNEEIKIGMTKEEVINLIGEPSRRQSWSGSLDFGCAGGKKEMWEYTSHSKNYDWLIRFSKPLTLLFDKNGKLIAVKKQLKI